MAKAFIGSNEEKDINYDFKYLTRHVAVLGTTGSGKTVMCKVLIEEALNKGVPVIAIDPKGDIGGLGITDENFDFRPFISSKTTAKKVAKDYFKHHYKNSLNEYKTQIFTPKSKVGIPVSLLPDLSRPKVFDKDDHNFVSGFVTPLAESITSLSSITSNKDKVETVISQILIDKWSKGEDVSISSLIELVIDPPFDKVGSLDLEDFLKEKDRKKAAASINLLLSSPAKKVWKDGVTLDMSKLLSKGSLNIFDLRYTSAEEKQFVVETVMSELYKYLLEKGGNEKLKYILYIDELAGLLPPAPANPPSKKLLELLIRQARAFGLGIVVATQNPGDIDYKILGNIGTRFVGKLRTANDLEKVAGAMDMSVSDLKADMSSVKTGEFFFNNSVSNTNFMMKARWLYSYHSGPLSEKQISYINNPSMMPKVSDSLGVEKESSKKNVLEYVSSSKKSRGRSSKSRNTVSKKSYLQDVIRQVKKYSDKSSVKVAVSKAHEFDAHLKIVAEIKPYKGEKFPLQGPYYFDLGSKMIPIDNYLKGYSWSRYVPKDAFVEKNKRSIKDAFLYAQRESRRLGKTVFFESPLTGKVSDIKEDIVKSNHEFTLKISKSKVEKLKRDRDRYVFDYEKKIKQNKKSISDFKKKLIKKKVKRTVKNLLTSRKLVKKTSEMKHYEKRVKALEKQNETYYKRVEKHKHSFEVRKQKVLDQAFDKARIHIKQKTYTPRNKDMVLHSTILLVPKRGRR
ncbi:MAG: ATP-binding protein [Candidatus Woesearchaeota archaeon]